jgi:Zn-finger nucleic acid-binding protein
MTCPNCRAAMTTQILQGRLGTTVTIDLCLPCQVFWFDTFENLRLSPAAVLKLFHIIGEQSSAPRAATAANPVCPRCGAKLLPTHDQQHNTRFQYLRCPRDHGRLTTFVDFLREKDFIRPLTAQQIEELRQNVQVVNCSNCGAPIDLTKTSSCTHCGSPLSMLDMKQAGALVAALREAEQPNRPIDPTLPLQLERARRDVEAAFASFEHGPGWFDDVSQGGLVGAGLRSLARWLKQDE